MTKRFAGLALALLATTCPLAAQGNPRDTTQYLGVFCPKIAPNLPCQYLSGTSVPVNVRDWGAKGDSVTDDYPAFKNLILWLNQTGGYGAGLGGTVLVPSGFYRISSQLPIITAPITFVGNSPAPLPNAAFVTGRGTAISCQSATGTCLRWSVQNTGNIEVGYGITGLTVNGPGAGTASVGIQIGGATNPAFGFLANNFAVSNFGTGVTMGATLTSSAFFAFQNGNFNFNGFAFNQAGNLTGEGAVFTNVNFTNNPFNFNSLGSQLIFMRCSFDNAGFTANVSSLFMFGTHFELVTNGAGSLAGSGTALVQINNGGSAILVNTELLVDPVAGATETEGISVSETANLVLDGVTAVTNQALARFVSLGATAKGRFTGIQKINGFTQLYVGGNWSALTSSGGVSPDRGDNNITLTPGADYNTQVFNTALSTNRTVTLNTSGLEAGNGAIFTIVRQAGATGVSTITACGKALALVSQFVVCEFNGVAWIETEFGTL